jgi:hypothetical protein
VSFSPEARSSPQILRSGPRNENRAPSRWDETRSDLLFCVVGDTGIEPVTSSVSRKRAPAAPIALDHDAEVETGFEPVYTALQAVASPLGHSTEQTPHVTCGGLSERTTGFEPATLTLAR